jgi:predicted MFS family arabinose efflux permease
MLRKFFHHWLNSFRGLGKDIWLLSFVNFINRLGSMVVLFLTIYLTEKRGYTIEEAGYILVFNGIGAVIGSYLGGWLTDRFGYYKLQIIALHIQGFVLFALQYVENPYFLAATVLFMSIASEAVRPANQVAFIAHSTPEMRTRAISLNRMGINLSFTAAPAIGGFLILWSWDAIFWVDAITCIAAAWLMVFFIQEKQVEPKVVSETDAEEVASISAYRDVPFLKFVGLSFINAVVFMQLIWTIPYFFSEAYHWDKPFIGLVLAVNGLIVALVEMPLIFRIENKYPILGLVRTGLLCYGASYLALAIGLPVAVAAALFVVIISFGEIYVMPFSFTYVSKLAGANRTGQYMALYTLAYAFSHIVSPFLGTQIIHRFGFNTLWVTLGVLSAFSFLGTRLLERQTERNNGAVDVKTLTESNLH